MNKIRGLCLFLLSILFTVCSNSTIGYAESNYILEKNIESKNFTGIVDLNKKDYSSIDPKILIPGNPDIDRGIMIPGNPDIDPKILIGRDLKNIGVNSSDGGK